MTKQTVSKAFLSILILLFTLMGSLAFGQVGVDSGMVAESNLIGLGGLGRNQNAFTLTSQNALRLYLALEGEVWSFSARGALSYSIDLADRGAEGPVSWIFSGLDSTGTVSGDLNSLSVSGNVDLSSEDGFNTLALRFGRFTMSDSGSAVFRQTLDGFSAYLIGNRVSVGMFAGYNGLLAKTSSQMVYTGTDQEIIADRNSFFAAPRFVTGAGMSIQSLGEQPVLENLGYSIDILYHDDLRRFINPQGLIEPGSTNPNDLAGGLYWSIYGINQLQYTVSSRSFIDITGTVQSGQTLVQRPGGVYELLPILAGSGNLNWTYFLPPFARVGVSGGFATGDGQYRSSYQEGAQFSEEQNLSSLYKPLTKPSLGVVFSPQPGNLAWIDGQISGRPFGSSLNGPLSRMQVTGRVSAFMRLRKGPISEAGAIVDTANPFVGAEVSGGVSSRILSDLGVGLNGGLFIPASFAGGVFEGTKPAVQYLLLGFVSLRF